MKKTFFCILCIVVLTGAYYQPERGQAPFDSGDGYGYACYRIPSIVNYTSDSLLCVAEGRKDDCDDRGDTDIVCKRSFNGGMNWEGEPRIIHDTGARWHNPCPVVDQVHDPGRIYVLYNMNLQRMYFNYSDNSGATWPNHTRITSAVPSDFYRGAFGPSAGIQMKNKFYGRLVIPYYYEDRSGNRKIRLLYKDNGLNWKSSAGYIQGDSTYVINEVSIMELASGEIYFNIRNQGDDRYRIHCKTTSSGSENFFNTPGDAYHTSLKFAKGLPDPKCQGSVLTVWPGTDHDIYAFANPANKTSRKDLYVRYASDDAPNWTRQKFAIPGALNYTGMTPINCSSIGVVYETDFAEQIDYFRFPKDWLTQPEIAVWNFNEGVSGQLVTEYLINNVSLEEFDAEPVGRLRFVDGIASSDKGIEFGASGKSYLRVCVTSHLNMREYDTFRVETVFKTSKHDWGGSRGAGALIAKDSATKGGPEWWLRVQDGHVKWAISDGNNYCNISSSKYVSDDVIYKAVAGRTVSESGTRRLNLYIYRYSDGTLLSSNSKEDTTTERIYNKEDVRIGNFVNYSRQFDGCIYDVKILNYEKSWLHN